MSFPYRLPSYPAFGVNMVPVMQPGLQSFYLPGQAAAPSPLILAGTPRGLPRQPGPGEKPPVTTVYIGNLPDRCTNDLVRAILQEIGTVVSWKRIQNSNGKPAAFGFCELEHPESTLRALRILNDFKLGSHKLTVKMDGKMRRAIKEWVAVSRKAQGKPELPCPKEEDLPCDEDWLAEDHRFVAAIRQIVHDQDEQLDPAPEDDEAPPRSAKSPTLEGKGGNLDIASLDREKKEYIAREISAFRDQHKDEDEEERERDKPSSNKKQIGPQPRGASSSRRSPERRRGRSRSDERGSSRRDGGSGRSGGGRSSGRGGRGGREDRRRRRRSYSSSSSSSSSSRSRSASSSSASSRSRSPSRSRGSRSRKGGGQGGGGSGGGGGGGGERGGSRGGRRRERSPRSASPELGSEDEEERREREAVERRLREKEEGYQARLKKWEKRERMRAKEYERYRDKERGRRREETREARKLKEFLEDYDDERDDPKFYRSGSLFQRRREYEKERQEDVKDRQREREELAELRARLEKEGCEDPEAEMRRQLDEAEQKLLRKLRAESDEPLTPRRKAREAAEEAKAAKRRRREEGREDGEESSSSSSSNEAPEAEDSDPGGWGKDLLEDAEKPSTSATATAAATAPAPNGVASEAKTGVGVKEEPVDEEAPKMGFQGLRLGGARSLAGAGDAGTAAAQSLAARIAAFGQEEEDEAAETKKLSFTVTAEERRANLTAEERKKMTKALIERIPTAKADLFAFPIDWTHVDDDLIGRRVRPWVNKKIMDYIGEEEPSLVDFICAKVRDHAGPDTILEDIKMVLDDEADVFVVKMWRLLIYEVEALKLGIASDK